MSRRRTGYPRLVVREVFLYAHILPQQEGHGEGEAAEKQHREHVLPEEGRGLAEEEVVQPGLRCARPALHEGEEHQAETEEGG